MFKFSKSESNYLEVKFLTPSFWRQAPPHRDSVSIRGFEIDLSTYFFFLKEEDCAWEISFSILGFGFSLYRQIKA